MLFRMKDEKAHQLEAELDKLQADGPAAWAKLPEESILKRLNLDMNFKE